MPPKNPRIAVSLKDPEYAAVTHLARSRGIPASRVISELLESSTSLLERVACMLDKAKLMDEGMKDKFRSVLDEADSKFDPILEVVKNQFDMFDSALLDSSNTDSETTERGMRSRPSVSILTPSSNNGGHDNITSNKSTGCKS